MRLWRSEVLYAVQFHLSIFFGDLTSALDWALTSEALDSRCRQICVQSQSDGGGRRLTHLGPSVPTVSSRFSKQVQ